MSRIAEILNNNEASLLEEWIREMPASTRREDMISGDDLRSQAGQILRLLREGAQTGDFNNVDGPQWSALRDFLEDMSRVRARLGFSTKQVATFLFSLKRPLFTAIAREYAKDPKGLAEETWRVSLMIDELGLITTESYQRSREEVIRIQQQEMLELSTPVVKLWDGILALPLIGTLDSARTQVVMETLLQNIVESGAAVAIIDITGVPTVDTLVAQHLLKTVTAARLMGADCIISGIRPQIAQTIVHLGVALGDVTTKASLADAFTLALARTGLTITMQAQSK